MLIDKDFDNLPDDPNESFVLLEQKLRDILITRLEDEDQGFAIDAYYVDYINGVVGLRDALAIEILESVSAEAVSGDAFAVYRRATLEIDRFAMGVRLGTADRRKRYTVGLTEAEKRKIRHHLEQAKVVVDEAILSKDKRDYLYKRLNDIVLEVDRDRTRLEILSYRVSQLAEAGEPFWKWIRLMFGVVGSAKEREQTQTLPGPRARPQIEAPRKRPQPQPTFDELDDEIPF